MKRMTNKQKRSIMKNQKMMLQQVLEKKIMMGFHQEGNNFPICYPISANRRMEKHIKDRLKVLHIVNKLENKKFLNWKSSTMHFYYIS